MSLTAVSRCLQCHAVVNVHWTACLVCKAPLPMVTPDAPSVLAGDAQPLPEPARISPIRPGWLVVYRDRMGKLRGGTDEREQGTVKECRWHGSGWRLVLTNEEHLPLTSIRAVGQTSEDGRLLAAWTVRECGLDGTNSNIREERSDAI